MSVEDFFTKYLIPSGVVVLALGYVLSLIQNSRKKRESIRSTRLTLLEKWKTDFAKINTIFESLRNDAEGSGNFTFKNINTIRPVVARIQAISTDELAVFEEDGRLRKEIINTGEFLSSFLVDVDNLENVASMQNTKEQEDKSKFKNEVHKLRRSVIKFGIQITPFNIVINPSGENANKHYNATLSALSELESFINESNNSIANMRSFLKDRRIFYSIKCLDAQNQLRSLIFLIEDAQLKYSKRNWAQKLLVRVT